MHPFAHGEVPEHSRGCQVTWRVTLAVGLLAFPKVVLGSLHGGETAVSTTSAKYAAPINPRAVLTSGVSMFLFLHSSTAASRMARASRTVMGPKHISHSICST